MTIFNSCLSCTSTRKKIQGLKSLDETTFVSIGRAVIKKRRKKKADNLSDVYSRHSKAKLIQVRTGTPSQRSLAENGVDPGSLLDQFPPSAVRPRRRTAFPSDHSTEAVVALQGKQPPGTWSLNFPRSRNESYCTRSLDAQHPVLMRHVANDYQCPCDPVPMTKRLNKPRARYSRYRLLLYVTWREYRGIDRDQGSRMVETDLGAAIVSWAP